VKISFSTLACPEYSWTDIYPMAADLGYDGIEIRGLGDDIAAFKAKPFRPEEIGNTKQKLKSIGLEIPCLSSGCCFKYTDELPGTLDEISKYVELAATLGTPFIRVLADRNPAPEGDVDDDAVAEGLKKAAEIAENADVYLLVETNGVYSDTKRLKKMLDKVNSKCVAALWDIHHPYRFGGESPETTVTNLGAYIKYTHVKDSVVKPDGQIEYRMCGEGDMPLEEAFEALKNIGYNGYVSLEWVKRWAADLQDAGIVFPQFADFMKPYRTKHKHPLQKSERGVGQYPWQKEKLVDLTFPDVLDRICEEFPNQYAFRYTELDYTRTYPQFRDDVDAFARALIGMGVRRGSHVAIWATNVPAWFITFWATVKIGAVLVTVNTAYKIHEAEYLLRQSDTDTLVMVDSCKDCDYVAIMKEICPELATSKPGQLKSKRLPYLRNIVTVDSRQDGCFTWDEAVAMGKDVPQTEVEARRREIQPHDVANMQYTSGTTGFPKGVMLTHYNVVNNGKSIGDCLDFSTEDKLLIQVPMFHCFGMVLAMTASMTHGTTMVPVPQFSPKKGLAAINKEKCTAVHGVPTMFIAMLAHEDFDKTDLTHMRTGIMAGSPCPIKVMEDVIEKMHMTEICITYGQTESSPAITMSTTKDSIDKRVATVGKESYAVEVQIRDPETNAVLPDEADGELCARGYNIMKGYYKMPEATAAAIDSEGWLHTGDLARRTKDGYYKITGRIKDMIIRGGENIYPKEIEDFLYTHPKVSDVQVIGVPDKAYGEEICACVILKDGETATEDEIKEYVKKSMAKHKIPRYVDFTDGFPMNAAGKILKYKMREDAITKLNLQTAAQIETA
jgi:fatty-acyl-CoA synthase